jgi:hypothetical protein
VFLIGKVFHFHYLLRELGMGGSIGKALSGLSVLELVALQVCSFEKDFFGVGRDLASKSLKQSLGWIGVIDQLSCILMKQGQQIFQLCSDFCR